jgi:hypothetical protein
MHARGRLPVTEGALGAVLDGLIPTLTLVPYTAVPCRRVRSMVGGAF